MRFGQQLIESARDAAVPTFQTADDLLAGIGAPTEPRRYYRRRVETLTTSRHSLRKWHAPESST